MAKELFFDFPTVDLLGNLQSSKKPIKSINNTDEIVIVPFFDGVVLVGDLLDVLKTYTKYSDLSDEIKNNVNNIQDIPNGDPNAFKTVNTALGRDPLSVNPLIIKSNYDEKNNKPDQTKTSTLVLFDISQRDWFKKEYAGDDKSFINAAIKNDYTFIAIWRNQILAAEIQLLLGGFSQKARLVLSSVTIGGYVKTQRDTYNAYVDAYKSLKEKAKSGDKQVRKDFGAVFNLPNDPDPALPGPPTQTISGVTNKAPVVDNPNIKLPSQEVKGLDANAAQQAASKAQGAASNVVSQAQNATGGLASQAQGVAEQAQGALGNAQQSAGGVLNNLSSGVKGALGGGALGAGIGALAGGGKGALIGAGAGVLAGGIAGSVVDKLNPKGIKPDALGKDWSPDKFSPESIAGNDKFVDPKTGMVGSTSKLASGLKGGILGGGLGAGIGALAGGGKGALIGGLSGTALGAGVAVGGVTGGTLAGAGLGTGIGGIVGGGKGAVIGAVTGGAVGAAAAKLASVQKGLPKPNIPKPPNTPRIKTVKIPRPDNTKDVQTLLNLPKSPLG